METKNPYKEYQDIKEFSYPKQDQYKEIYIKYNKPTDEMLNGSRINAPVYKNANIDEICENFDVFTFNRYQAQAITTKSYPEKNAIIYPALGLSEETGEVTGKIKKWLRGDVPELDKEAMKKEMGDVLWYLASLADDLGLSLEDIARTNISKLKKRKETGTLKGNGDNREETANNNTTIGSKAIYGEGMKYNEDPYGLVMIPKAIQADKDMWHESKGYKAPDCPEGYTRGYMGCIPAQPPTGEKL